MTQNIESTKPVSVNENLWDYFATNMPSNFTESDNMTVPAPEHEMVVGVYSALLVVGAMGNMAVFTALMRSRRRKSRVNLLMTHLVVADMMVTFIVIPLEVSTYPCCVYVHGRTCTELHCYNKYLLSASLLLESVVNHK